MRPRTTSGADELPQQPRAVIPTCAAAVKRGAAHSGKPWPTIVLGLTLAAAVAAPTLDRGGFTAGGQELLIVLASVALFQVVLFLPRELSVSLRTPLASSLLVLGALASLSAAWTIGSPGPALRAGLVIAAYGAMAVCGGALARRTGPWPIAISITGIAALEGVLGLTSAALREPPLAELIGGSWRPEGTFEYAPALGLLEICGLPVALRLAASASRGTRYVGASALAVAGAVLGCAESRADLALAAVALVALAWLADPRALPRRVVLAGAVLLAGAAVAGAVLLGRHATAGAHTGGAERLIGIAAAWLVLSVLWSPLQSLAGRFQLRRLLLFATIAIAGGVALWLAVGYAGTLFSTGNGVDHGRISYWRAAVRAWEERPIVGSGASTFAQASARFQARDDPTLFAHDLPLELAAELGVLGFLAALAVYLAAGLTCVRAIRAPGAWLLAVPVAVFLLDNLVDWPWHLAGFGAAWAVAAGGLAAVGSSPDRPAAAEPAEPADPA